MRSPYGLGMVESCAACTRREPGYFCDFPEALLRAFEALKYAALFPKGAMLFVEGQAPRGIFMLCAGRVKLAANSSDGKSLITRIAAPGEVLGLSATISGKPYMATAETLLPCQVNFIRREDFLRFLSEHNLACLRVAQHLSQNCYAANDQVRALGLAHTAAEKLAKLILEWCARDGKPSARGIQLKLTLTHEEIAHRCRK